MWHTDSNSDADTLGNSDSESNGNLNSYCYTKCNPDT